MNGTLLRRIGISEAQELALQPSSGPNRCYLDGECTIAVAILASFELSVYVSTCLAVEAVQSREEVETPVCHRGYPKERGLQAGQQPF